MKLASPSLAATDEAVRNAALAGMAEALRSHADELFEANRLDLAQAEADQVSTPVMKRLRFDEKKLQDVCAGITQLITLPDPLGEVLLNRQLDEGLVLRRISCPIGVIGVIFEARPDALVQISSLCIKSGNCAILKGGRETAHTNAALFRVLHEAVLNAGLPAYSLVLAQERSEIAELLSCDEYVDLLIPRGSNQFVRYIMDNTRIPVMGHAEGVCHLYVDAKCDRDQALKIIADAKTQYPVACNAVETILVNRAAANDFLPALAQMAERENILIYGTEEVCGVIRCERMPEEKDAFHHEYGDLQMTVALVSDVKEAVDHINRYGSHHTDGILTTDDEAAAYFMRMTDSAGVYRNCSTRFADGFRYGFGAEVGISTGKLHARGPVGLGGLVTYKYLLDGDGHIVGDYASGRRQFHFIDKDCP